MTQKSRSVAFGVPVSVPTEQRKRVMNDQYLFPREAGMFGNCAETNAWTTRPDLPIKSRTNNHEYREFHENKDKWLIDQNYFNDTYGITSIRYGGSLMF
ncbi:hypothetical protein RhiirC2_767603 [Rhizophagus irregularis]|uniref:Uncharacterized protein n=1 Tax=Rhizophagus irregularis TaxID=588596 RepID=A0A2N1P404_9GLOM|nr:hypothetical protein RhiirC2_767603 [Rhizophagus irregularis]